MIDFTIHIPQMMFNQLTEYCDGIGENVEDFVFNLIADKLFTDLHGDINTVLSGPHKVNNSNVASGNKPEPDIQTAVTQEHCKILPKTEENNVSENKSTAILTVEPTPPKIEDKDVVETRKPVVRRTTRTIKTK